MRGRLRRLLGVSASTALVAAGALVLVAAPAGATNITAASGDIDLTSATGNLIVGNDTQIYAEDGNGNLTAPQGAVQVSGASSVQASGNVTMTSGASGSLISGSLVAAIGGSASIASTGSGSITQSKFTAEGDVTISDTGAVGDTYTVSQTPFEVAPYGLPSVEVVAQGGCAGALTAVTALVPLGVEPALTMSYSTDPVTGCPDAELSSWSSGLPGAGAATPVVIAGGPGGPNQVESGEQQGGVTTLGAGSPGVTVTFAGDLPLATIVLPASVGQYSYGETVPTFFYCNDTCEDSNGQAGPHGSLDTSTPGSQTYRVTAQGAGFTYTASIGYTVTPAVPTLTWNPLASITYGTPLSSTQLDATASVPGTFAYRLPVGTVLRPGSQQLSVTFTPTDGTDYTTATAMVTLYVNPAPLTITASSNAEPYGSAIPAITPSYSGFVNGDGPGSLTTAPTCSTGATAGSPVGTYATSCSGAVDPDYTVSYVAGTMVITKAATTLVASPISVLGSVTSVHVTFSATLTSNVTGAGVASQSVTFTWAGGHCSALTNSSGVATCDAWILDLVPLLLAPQYAVTYGGAADYQGTSDSAGLMLL
jgi:hypothetical protein